MAEMFGISEGFSRAIQDQGTEALTKLRLGEVAMQPATKRLTEAHAEHFELENEVQRRYNALMQQQASGQGGPGGGGQPVDMASMLDNFATTAARAGMPEKAASLAGHSSQIRMHQATQMNQQSEMEIRDLTAKSKRLEVMGNLLGSAKDQPSWDAVNRLYGVISGQPSPYEGTPYSPDLTKQISEAVLSAKQRADLGLRAQHEAQIKVNQDNEEKQRQVREDLMRQRTKESEARTRKLEKLGAGTNKPSMARDAKYATGLMTSDWLDLDPGEAKIFAQQIAERSAELQADNPGMKASEAVTRAYEEHKAAGTFFGLTPNDKRPGAAQFNTPAPMPQDKKALKKDQVYNTPLGRGRWNGTSFDRVK